MNNKLYASILKELKILLEEKEVKHDLPAKMTLHKAFQRIANGHKHSSTAKISDAADCIRRKLGDKDNHMEITVKHLISAGMSESFAKDEAESIWGGDI